MAWSESVWVSEGRAAANGQMAHNPKPALGCASEDLWDQISLIGLRAHTHRHKAHSSLGRGENLRRPFTEGRLVTEISVCPQLEAYTSSPLTCTQK